MVSTRVRNVPGMGVAMSCGRARRRGDLHFDGPRGMHPIAQQLGRNLRSNWIFPLEASYISIALPSQKVGPLQKKSSLPNSVPPSAAVNRRIERPRSSRTASIASLVVIRSRAIVAGSKYLTCSGALRHQRVHLRVDAHFANVSHQLPGNLLRALLESPCARPQKRCTPKREPVLMDRFTPPRNAKVQALSHSPGFRESELSPGVAMPVPQPAPRWPASRPDRLHRS